VPTFRPDLDSIQPYIPGRPIDEVARDLGISDIVKIASNEHPEPPFPEVQAAIAAASKEANRYPEDSSHYLVQALAARYMISPDHIWIGAGSTQILGSIALAVGGPGTSAVFADPSFVMYPIATAVAGAARIAVPTDDLMRHDLEAMADAVQDDTTVVYVCNPDNPTATHVAKTQLGAFIARVPRRVLIVIDEAYAEYATAPDYATSLPHALERDNVVVTRTFSKVYGLAGLRIGYAIGQPDTLRQLRKVQAPFSVNSIAQAAALASLDFEDRLEERVKANTTGRDEIEAALAARGLEFAPSQTNFVMFAPDHDPITLSDALLHEGVIVRPMGPWIRVTVGTPAENQRFFGALDRVAEALSK
jgi:histidinol-phosphate aminotransferase